MQSWSWISIEDVEKWLNVLLIKGVSLEIQQGIKVLVFLIAALLLFKILSILQSLILRSFQSFDDSPIFLFILIMSLLLLTVTDKVSFNNACMALLLFSILGIAYAYFRKPKINIQKDKANQSENEK
ncbi:MAG: hypothetical protein Q9M28_04355 [Mariprofundaceae bacterium]|nr:hypothetical protein [Mariprofundaceae bacterium]